MIGENDVKLSARLRVLSGAELQAIRSATLEALGSTGVDVFEGEALSLLREAGAPVTAQRRVLIPSELIERAVETAPRRVILFSRDGSQQIALEGNTVFFGTGSDCPKIVDPFTGQSRPFTKEDAARAARLADALRNLSFHMSVGLVSDVPRLTSDRHQFAAMLLNTSKPVVFTAHNREGMQDILRIGAVAAGGERALSERPSVCLYAEPVSPLRHIGVAVEKLLLAADRRIPVVYTPGATSGGTLPATLAGALVVANCEVLSGLVIHQLKNPGAPFIGGGVLTIMDMSSGIFSYGAPELSLLSAAFTEVIHSYGLPVFGTCGCSDAKELDQQAAIEATFSTLTSALSGANLVHDIGYLESGLLGSFEMMVLTDEVIGMIKRMLQGIRVDEETLGLDVIHKVGPGGHFLTDEHTLRHFRAEQFFPRLLDRQNYANWAAAGGKSMKERLNQEVRRILADYEPEQVPEERRKAISAILSEADREVGEAA